MKILQTPSNHAKALKDIRKHENSLDQRRALPHNVLSPIQENLMLNNPDVDMSRTWLASHLKGYKDYDRLGIFKETGRKCIAEVRDRWEGSTLEQVLGVQSTDDHDTNGDKDNEDIEEEKEGEERAGKKVIETMTFFVTKYCAVRNGIWRFFKRYRKRTRPSWTVYVRIIQRCLGLDWSNRVWETRFFCGHKCWIRYVEYQIIGPKDWLWYWCSHPDECCTHTKRRWPTKTGE